MEEVNEVEVLELIREARKYLREYYAGLLAEVEEASGNRNI